MSDLEVRLNIMNSLSDQWLGGSVGGGFNIAPPQQIISRLQLTPDQMTGWFIGRAADDPVGSARGRDVIFETRLMFSDQFNSITRP